jgi:hypothetical protein
MKFPAPIDPWFKGVLNHFVFVVSAAGWANQIYSAEASNVAPIVPLAEARTFVVVPASILVAIDSADGAAEDLPQK